MASSQAEYSRLQGEEERCIPIGSCSPEEDALIEPVGGYAPSTVLAKKVLCEFIGSFILVFAAAGSAIMNKKSENALGIHGAAGGAGIAVTIVILATGHISGAHINPAVTLAFATFRHFSWIQVPLYIVAQSAASIAAAFVLKGMYHPDLSAGVTVPAGSYLQSFLFEIALTAILMFVITSVATDTRAVFSIKQLHVCCCWLLRLVFNSQVGELAGVAVGLTVYLDILLGGYISGASMNPVRTLGPGIAANNYRGYWIYFVGPLLGAQIGAGLYTLIRFKDQPQRRRTFKE